MVVPMPQPRRDTTTGTPGELRERILAAMRQLLDEQQFDQISVAHILTAAGISRASFYFYFPSRQAVLAELVRRAVDAGEQAAEPWTDGELDPVEALRAGITAGARLWRRNAGVLLAIVGHWMSDDALRALWLEQMGRFTEATVARIEADEAALAHLAGQDVRAVASSLTWLGERLYSLAAAGVAPFDDEAVLVGVLLHAWVQILYGERDG
jgi:AcrR family transcriptional regulator